MAQRMDYDSATPAGTEALNGVYDHIMHSRLPKTLVDPVFLRFSQINQVQPARQTSGGRMSNWLYLIGSFCFVSRDAPQHGATMTFSVGFNHGALKDANDPRARDISERIHGPLARDVERAFAATSPATRQMTEEKSS